MSTTYHTAIVTGESNAPATINTRLATLDAAIVARAAEITALNTSGVGSVYAQINNASGEDDTSWAVDNISGAFLAGATVVYSVAGVVYTSTVAANTSTSPLTVTAAPGVTIPDNTTIAQVPAALAGKMLDGTINVKDPAYTARGDGSTDDTQALLSAFGIVHSTVVSGSGTSVTVANGALFSDGDTIEITQDDNTLHRTTINGAPSGNVLTLTDALTDTVTLGNLVVRRITSTAVANMRDERVYLPAGTYVISRPIQLTASLYGAGWEKTTIQASATFAGSGIFDLEGTRGTCEIERITLDANDVSGVACLFSATGGDGAGNHYRLVRFENVVAGTYAVNPTAPTGTVNGMLAGAVFLQCHFRNCAGWVKVEQNCDDILFQGCRFHCDPGYLPSGAGEYYAYIKTSKNIQFNSCYFNMGDTDNTTVPTMIALSNTHVAFRSCFWEETAAVATGAVLTSLVRGVGTSDMASFDACLYNFDSTQVDTIAYYTISANTRSKFAFTNCTMTDTDNASVLVVTVAGAGGVTTSDYLSALIYSNKGFADAWNSVSGDTSTGILRAFGEHNGAIVTRHIIRQGTASAGSGTTIQRTSDAQNWEFVTDGTANALLSTGKATTIGTADSNVLTIVTNNTTAVRVHTTQNMSVGTTADNARLTVAGAISITDGMTAPSATSGYAKLYVDTADGDLKVIFGDGTVKTIVTDT